MFVRSRRKLATAALLPALIGLGVATASPASAATSPASAPAAEAARYVQAGSAAYPYCWYGHPGYPVWCGPGWYPGVAVGLGVGLIL
ncbi:hypothetical protein [Yinghuangia soli]|uniref:Uncharacterized protein n=1 Tax=Yinghuangia soli TaxID=2908204 RepID=A0AA41Q265_9ACTN|nr:hypothetical protein [Yinghuangia soli]MCF2530185.1 hypothetical protein [Yinghuangia soli]